MLLRITSFPAPLKGFSKVDAGKSLAVMLLCVLFVTLSREILNAQVVVTSEETIVGSVLSKTGQNIAIKTTDGETINALIANDRDQSVVTLANGVRLRAPLTTIIEGTFDVSELEPGDLIQFEGRLNRLGKTMGALDSISLMVDPTPTGLVPVDPDSDTTNDYPTYRLTSTFNKTINGRLLLNVPNNQTVKQKILSFELAPKCRIRFSSVDPNLISRSMTVQQATIQKMNSGDYVVKSIKLSANHKPAARDEFDRLLRKKYAHLSTSPMEPRMIRSQHFIFMSDVSEQDAKVLLEKLETMHSLLRAYFGAAPGNVIEGFVVRDLAAWPQELFQEPAGVAKIKEGAGICFSSSLGNKRRAVVYSCADHGVIQHESTHGFCSLTFGSTGPTWLAEGIAELGQYWKLGEKHVSAPSHVIDHIRRSKQKQLLEIAVPGRVPAGNWQDYAWRWALCHLLANNPNYSPRFKPLAISLMQGNPTVSFANTYGDVAPQISFEYELFLKQVKNGYRSDLCAWQWNRRFSSLNPGKPRQVKIQAKYGWQATGLILEKGKSYDLAAVGEWSIHPDVEKVTANGDDRGVGKLAGVIFKDYALTKEFDLGTLASFPAPQDGRLFVRCKEPFESIQDNSGEIELFMRISP